MHEAVAGQPGLHPEPKNFTSVCEDYTLQNTEFSERLFRLFERGVEYTTLSLTLYRDKYAMQPMLSGVPDDEEDET